MVIIFVSTTIQTRSFFPLKDQTATFLFVALFVVAVVIVVVVGSAAFFESEDVAAAVVVIVIAAPGEVISISICQVLVLSLVLVASLLHLNA